MRAAVAAAALLGACASVVADTRTLDGTNWRVVAVNGQATPGGDQYRLGFDRGRVSGRFGCNAFDGRYTVSAGALTMSDVASTLMGCPEPAAAFEAAGLRILSGPMRLDWTSGVSLKLSNEAGTIDLQR